MRAFATVFAREVFARRLVFPVALAAGFMPLVGSLYYGWSRPDAAEGRVLVALVTAAAFSFAFALLFGGSVIAGETSEKRISFFFSRPISAVSIWAGKVLAVLVLTLVPATFALVPALATSMFAVRQSVLRLGGAPGAALGLFLVTLFFIFGAHAAVTIARLRSPWVALDLILAPALVLLTIAFLRSLLRNGLFGSGSFDAKVDLGLFLAGLAAVALAALVAASCAQVTVGRTDARRSHGVFSVVLWGILGTATVALGGYAWWVASARAIDLASIRQNPLAAPRGPWLAVGGPLQAGRGYGIFLFDAARTRSLRMGEAHSVFSPDGTRAGWGEPRLAFFERKDNRLDLYIADLAMGRPVATGLEAAGWAALAFSPSGRRLAVRDGQSLTAYDVSNAANPRQLAAFPVPDGSRGVAFVDEETIRLFPRFLNAANRKDLGPANLEITEFSLTSKQSLVTGHLGRETLPFLRLSADARYFVGTRRTSEGAGSPQALTLHDGRSGALLATLADDLRNPQARFLMGNRIAVAGIAEATAQMKILVEGQEGQPPNRGRTIDLGPAKRVVLGGEIAPGSVAVSLLPFEESLPASRRIAKLVIVDVATGVVTLGPDGLIPADRFSWWFSPVLPPGEAGLPYAALFLDGSDRLVRLDPTTGAQTVLLGRSK
jgi:ABC-type transport system involved in multi-copper enzyme maturation permease subunit/catechol 2,3-dioxygenase-like lactoylglutathione lyase family enzyme